MLLSLLHVTEGFFFWMIGKPMELIISRASLLRKCISRHAAALCFLVTCLQQNKDYFLLFKPTCASLAAKEVKTSV